MSQTLVLMLLMLLAMPTPVFSREIRLDECVDLALRHNSGLKASAADTMATQEEAAMAFKDFLPSLHLLGNYTIVDKSPRLVIYRDAFGAGMPPTDTELTLGEKNFYSLMVSVTQPLFRGGILTNSYRKAQAQSEESTLRYDQQRSGLIFDVKKAFYSTLAEQLVARSTEQLLLAKKERLRVIRELHKEGYLHRDDVLRQETDILFTELELLRSKNREATARARLANLIHHDESTALLLAIDSVNGRLTATMQELRETALGNRKDLQAGQKRAAMAVADVAIARGGFYPQVALTGSFLQQRETGIARPQVWSLTATLDWSLFEWGKSVNDVRRATARKEQEQYRLDETTRQVAQEAELAWRTVMEEELAVAAHENQVKTTEYRLGREMKQFAEGQLKLADLLESEAEFSKAHNGYLAAVTTLASERARLEYVTATSLESSTIPQPLYQPDMTLIAKRLTTVVQQRLGKASPRTTAAAAPTGKASATPTPPVKHETPVIIPPAQPAVTGGHFAIQAASLTSLNNARELRDRLSRKTGGKKVTIITDGKFNKVRITGFNTKEEAELLAENLGITNYLVIRTANGL
jgi:outer membrane protein